MKWAKVQTSSYLRKGQCGGGGGGCRRVADKQPWHHENVGTPLAALGGPETRPPVAKSGSGLVRGGQHLAAGEEEAEEDDEEAADA